MAFYDELKQKTSSERDAMYHRIAIKEALEGRWSLEQYTDYLTEAYHHVKHTVPLLMCCGGALPWEYAWLRKAMAEYIDEEVGHEEWILNDLAACGKDKEQVRSSQPALATDHMISYAYYSIEHIHPVTFLGMIFVLEGSSVDLASDVAEKLKHQLGLPSKAFSYLTSHGAVDKEHIHFFESLANQIENQEHQKLIIHMAKRMYGLFGEVISQAVEKKQERVAA